MDECDECKGIVKLSRQEENRLILSVSLAEDCPREKIIWIKSGCRVFARRTRLDGISGKTV